MKRYWATLILIIGVVGRLHAAPCDSSTACEQPSFSLGPTPADTTSGWFISASGVSAIRCLVSVGPTGNQAGSRYWFAASSVDLGASVANGGIVADGNGLRVISVTFASNGQATPTSLVSGGSLPGLRGNQNYYFYAQACPTTVPGPNDSSSGNLCSSWARIRPTSITTNPYPTSVFATPTPGADATINSIVVRSSVPVGDTGNVQTVNLTLRDLDNGLSQTLLPLPFSPTQTFTLTNAEYNPDGIGFRPNTSYEYDGQVLYPWNVLVPTAGVQTRGVFSTTPADPGTTPTWLVAATHFTARVQAINTSGTLGNPVGTRYRFRVTGPGVNVTSITVVGAGQTAPGSVIGPVRITGLAPETTYDVTVQALNDVAGWNNSAVISLGSFTTLPLNPTYQVPPGNVTTSAARFIVNVGQPTGLTSYQILTCPRSPASGSCFTSASIPWPFSGGAEASQITYDAPFGAQLPLNYNTPYHFQIVFYEGSDASASMPIDPTVSINPTVFNTTPAGPVAPGSGALVVTPVSITANWQDSLNPSWTTYEVRYCRVATGSCSTQTTSAGALSNSVNSGLITGQSYNVQVRALNYTGAPPWSHSAYTDLGTVVIPDSVPGVSAITMLPPPPVTGTTANVSVTVTDSKFPTGPFTYNWIVVSGSSVSFSPNNTNTASSAVATFTQAGTYTIQVQVINPDSVMGVSAPLTFQVNQTLTTAAVNPPNAIVQILGGQSFTAIGFDQFGLPMSSTFTWNVSGGGSINGAGQFSALAIGQSFLVTATNGSVVGTANLSVINTDVSHSYAYPVPFRGDRDTAIHFKNLGTSAKIHIYTINGREIFSIPTNQDTYDWYLLNNDGDRVASGLYFYRVEGPDGEKKGKIVILK